MANGTDPDQGRHSVGPDLGPNCLQKLSADDKGRHRQLLYWSTKLNDNIPTNPSRKPATLGMAS